MQNQHDWFCIFFIQIKEANKKVLFQWGSLDFRKLSLQKKFFDRKN